MIRNKDSNMFLGRQSRKQGESILNDKVLLI